MPFHEIENGFSSECNDTWYFALIVMRCGLGECGMLIPLSMTLLSG